MYTPVIMTQSYRVIKRGGAYEELEEAKKAARLLSIDVGQMYAVIDDNNLIHWQGGTKKVSKFIPLPLPTLIHHWSKLLEAKPVRPQMNADLAD
jgi:hypothetical protein